VNRRGVSYDVGRVLGVQWRPVYDPKVVHRELEIIKNDLHCNAVRICGLSIARLIPAAEAALQQGLEVWLSPEMWDQSQEKTLAYIAKAAAAAEPLRRQWKERLVFSVGSEATLFMQGIVEGRNITKRMSNPSFWQNAKAGTHNAPLNAFLAKATKAVRGVFHGQITYAALIWEAVDWSLFDFVGVDHYRAARIKDRYTDMLKPLLTLGKPVIVTEFGFRAYRGAEDAVGLPDIVDNKSLFLHQLPLVGRFVRPRMKVLLVRDEELQARELTDQLHVLDGAGVDGAFIMTFVAPIAPHSDDPRYDIDMSSYGLVKSYERGHGTTYPDMPWEPKAAFKAAAEFYGSAATVRVS